MKPGFDTIKDILDVVIIPLLLVIVGRLVIWWDQKRKEKQFLKLIIRELQEVKPHPEEKAYEYEWCWHLKKRFIHERIFGNPHSNTDFILSIDPDIVYFLTQMWLHFYKAEKAAKLNTDSKDLTDGKKEKLLDNGGQWIYYLGKICYLLTNKFIGNSFSVANPFSRKIINKKDINLCNDIFVPWRDLLLKYDERYKERFQEIQSGDKDHCLQ